MSKNKRSTRKNSKKNSNGNLKSVESKIQEDLLNDVSIKKVTVTMETIDGSMITTTETKSPNGTIERETHFEDNHSHNHHEHIHKEKNDYLETNIDKYDDKELKTVTRTTKNPDGTITKKTTVVTTYPDGRLHTDHTETTIYPEELEKPTLSKTIDTMAQNDEVSIDNQIEMEHSIEEIDQVSKKDLESEEDDKVTTQKYTDREIQKIESVIENPDGSHSKKIETITLYNDGFLNRKTEILPNYSELPKIISSLDDYLNLYNTNNHINNSNHVTCQNFYPNEMFKSEKNEILNEVNTEHIDEKNLYSFINDFGAELMSKHVHLLNYYGNIEIKELKNNLILYLVQNRDRIRFSEMELDSCLKSIDYNSDGVLNYVEFVDFFCLFFSSKQTIRKNLLSVLNEHNVNHTESGYLNRNEASKFFNFLRQFYNLENECPDFPNRITYEMFITKCAPLIENQLYVK
ncbi:unnamed protein product [Brachionus calyciflorus]|uniref:EF-hand domain-containing protein n=1 Tax=Brachionus calyciflorus TaxID=104777 RepID=A0A813YBQ1_9BILA|nr:unnamed protein product [Brachionus calyciflorus]